jgi:nitronate monooxygenase
MWPKTQLVDLLQIAHPVIQAPMAGLGTVELAAAVCAGGGLGSIGCALQQPEAAASTIRDLQARTSRPFNVNFFCHRPARDDARLQRAWYQRLSPYYRELRVAGTVPRVSELAPFGESMCSVIEGTRPRVVSFHFGLPDAVFLDRIRAAGCCVMSSATTVEEALWLEAKGADVVIAQGHEAGGHRATFLRSDPDAAAQQPGMVALVPQVVDAVKVPVVAAGGIADGRGIAAAFALGAAGVQIGTAYLRCPEAATTQLHREALRHSSADATLLTNVFTGRPARAICNRIIREIGPILGELPDFPFASGALAPLRAAAEAKGAADFTPLWSGQAAPLGRSLPAKLLTVTLASEAMERFCALWPQGSIAGSRSDVPFVGPYG